MLQYAVYRWIKIKIRCNIERYKHLNQCNSQCQIFAGLFFHAKTNPEPTRGKSNVNNKPDIIVI
jgi:hypothetical protein